MRSFVRPSISVRSAPWSSKLLFASAAAALAFACANAEEQPDDPADSGARPSPAEGDGGAPTPDAATDPADAATSLDASRDAAEGGPACATTPCSVVPQCGCGATETCDGDSTRGYTCVAAGAAPKGRACLSTGNCAKGLVCAGGICRTPCATEGEACPSGGTCRGYVPGAAVRDAGAPSDAGAGDAGAGGDAGGDAGLGGGNGAGATLRACSVPCEYASETSCGYTPGASLAAGCIFDAVTSTTDCRPMANVPFSLCTADQDCAPGRTCVTFAGVEVCRKVCKVDDRSACGGCNNQLFPAPRVVDGTSYGTCP